MIKCLAPTAVPLVPKTGTAPRPAQRGLAFNFPPLLPRPRYRALVAAARGHVVEVRHQVFDRLPAGRATNPADLLRPIVDKMKATTSRS